MFRPCIDLHEGSVKQIVGSSLGDAALQTNFVSDRDAAWYAALYKRDALTGGHIIMLGAGNESAAKAALAAYPGGMQIGGGINIENAQAYLDAGASHVILTSWIFYKGGLDWERLKALKRRIGKERIVLDLSCRPFEGGYYVMTDRWRKRSRLRVDAESLEDLAGYCDGFLVHAVDREGLVSGIDPILVEQLARSSPLPITYAGGARSLADLEEVTRLSDGRVDLTIGSALDIFGGTGVRYEDVVAFNRQRQRQRQ